MAGIIDLAIVSALFKQEFFKINKIAGRDFRDRKQIRLFGYRDIDIGGYAEGLVEFTLFSCNDNDAVTGSGAPDRRGGGILQDRDAFHVVGIERCNIAFIRKIIHDDQWFCNLIRSEEHTSELQSLMRI